MIHPERRKENLKKIEEMDKPYECITSFQNGIEVGDRKELVRCKDCKWHDNADDSPKYLPCMEMRTNPNWFCAEGERRTDDA